jgi:replication factor C subunit 2/4
MLLGIYTNMVLIPARLLLYSHRIIEPLASRCSKFRFKPLDGGSTSARLEHIAAAESLDITPVVIQALISSSQGDLRRAITYLQSAARLNLATKSAPNASAEEGGSEEKTGTPDAAITPRDIQEIAGVVPDEVINSFATALGIEIVGADSGMEVDNTPNGSNPTKGFDGVRQKVRELMREGYPASQLLTQVSAINHILRAKEFKHID